MIGLKDVLIVIISIPLLLFFIPIVAICIFLLSSPILYIVDYLADNSSVRGVSVDEFFTWYQQDKDVWELSLLRAENRESGICIGFGYFSTFKYNILRWKNYRDQRRVNDVAVIEELRKNYSEMYDEKKAEFIRKNLFDNEEVDVKIVKER